MKQDIKDGLIFSDDENPEVKVIFNFYSWVKIVEATIVKYGKLTPEEAKRLVEMSGVCQNTINSYLGVALISHELMYDWAMHIAFGSNYWEKGIDSEPPEDYFSWLNQYTVEHDLAEDIFIFYPEQAELFNEYLQRGKIE